MRCADLGYILCAPPWILKEVEKEVLFDGWDPRSVGNGTAVSSAPDGNHALTLSGIRLCRRSLETRNGIHGIVCRSFRWKRVGGGRPDRPGDEDLEARQRHCCSYHCLLLLPDSFFIRVKGEGASGNARRGHPSRLFSL